MRLTLAALAFTTLLAPLPAAADEITDALTAAIAAYEDGDIARAQGEIAFATQRLGALQAVGLGAYLPEAPQGWTREVETDASSMAAMFGGGTIARAEYRGPDGRVEITLMADSPMIMTMGAMFGNPTLMASMGQIERVNGQMFVNDNGEITSLIGNRVLVQASARGAEDAAMSLLGQMDFEALAQFGQ